MIDFMSPSCRDGLPEKHKKRPSTERPGDHPKKQQNCKSTEVTEPRVSTFTRKTKDRRLEELELLHKQSNVSNNLQLSPGHRLKCKGSIELKRKRKPIPDFKIDYTELNDLHKMNRTDYDLVELYNDEDDLPAAAEIFSVDISRGRLVETGSDINSLTRTVHLDDEIPTTATGCIENKVSDRRPLVPNKRKKAMEPKTANKRIRSERLGLESQCHASNVSLGNQS